MQISGFIPNISNCVQPLLTCIISLLKDSNNIRLKQTGE